MNRRIVSPFWCDETNCVQVDLSIAHFNTVILLVIRVAYHCHYNSGRARGGQGGGETKREEGGRRRVEEGEEWGEKGRKGAGREVRKRRRKGEKGKGGERKEEEGRKGRRRMEREELILAGKNQCDNTQQHLSYLPLAGGFNSKSFCVASILKTTQEVYTCMCVYM